ncbi:glutamate receptor ionotropic, NMDA 1-like, partial [Paramuricea clavata]
MCGKVERPDSVCMSATETNLLQYCFYENVLQFVAFGMLVELLDELTKRVAFTPSLHFVKDNKFGSKDTATGSWNGMIGEVLRNEADTALYSLTITETRSKVVDFSYPFLASGSGIIISTEKQKSLPHINNSFLRPFSRNLWTITLSIFAACVLILWTAERWNRRRRHLYGIALRATPGVGGLMESVSYAWGVVVQKVVQEGGPRTFGGRVVTGVFGFYMIILLSTYTANMAAIQVVEEKQAEISGIYDDK